MPARNICLECGACCAFYRASFYFGETDDLTLGGVPAGLTEPLTAFLVCMKGTRSEPVRCVALRGTVGDRVCCDIYERRSSACREFPPSFENGIVNERCDAARAAHGLSPLGPADFVDRPVKATPGAR